MKYGKQSTRSTLVQLIPLSSRDFYLRNPNDWQFMRMEMERTGKKVDYSKLEVKAVVLVAVWSGIVAFFVSNAFIAVTTGQSFWAFLGK